MDDVEQEQSEGRRRAPDASQEINTDGGAVVQGDVRADGDFVGRDKIINVYPTVAKEELPPQPFEPQTVPVPAGPFVMGDDDTDAAPRDLVDLPAFRIGLYPVTNEQFAQFVWKTSRVVSNELLWVGNRPPPGEEKYPVSGVTWYEARDYCDWLQEQTGRPYTLPSEAQWEKAARGIDGRLYPWGDDWDPARCNTNPDAIAAVKAHAPQSPYGCYDMVGNAREWTTTLWGGSPQDPDEVYQLPWAPDGRDDPDAPPTVRRIYRGGRGSAPEAYRCAVRGSYLPERRGPRRNRHGFRVCLTPD